LTTASALPILNRNQLIGDEGNQPIRPIDYREPG